MATVTLYRCVVPHWQGDRYVPAGETALAGVDIIPAFFVADEVEVPEPKKTSPKKDG